MRAIRYNNPHDYKYLINDFDMTNSINLTVSQTLCNAIISCCKFDNPSKRCNFMTLTSFIDCIFPTLNDVNNNIKKYNIVSSKINEIEDSDTKRSLMSMKGELLRTIELLDLLGIPSKDFKDSCGNDKILNDVVELITYFEGTNPFIVEKPNEMRLYENFEKFIISNRIVYVHGIHQFTPIMLVTFELLEKYNYDVVFVYNYNKDFPRIYSTWEKIYKNFHISETIDYSPKETVFENKQMNIAYYLEGKINRLKKYSDLEIQQFTTITNLTEFVKQEYEFGLSEWKRDPEIKNREHRSPVSYMNRQFYGVNGANSNAFLKVIYPEQFKERHFLSYPVGQFIMGLYNSWDIELNDLVISDNFVPVLSYDIWKSAPITMYKKIRYLIKENLPLNKYLEKLYEIKKNIENLFQFINRYNCELAIGNFNRLVYFNYTLKELEEYISVLQEIKSLAINTLDFGYDNFNIIKHMNKLLMFVETRQRGDVFIDNQLIEILKEKLNDVSLNNMTGSVDDMRESMFILYQASQSEGNANWIIRDLEQLDGEVFNQNTTNRIIHLTQLSDEEIDMKVKNSRLWPLDDLLDRSQLVNNKVIIYHNSKVEYGNFLRFMLFYTVYFSRKNIELSYIGYSIGEKRTPLYFLNDIGYRIRADETIGDPNSHIGTNKRLLIKDQGCILRKRLKLLDPVGDYFDDELQMQRFIIFMIQFTLADYWICLYQNKCIKNKIELNHNMNIFKDDLKGVLRRLLSEISLNVFDNIFNKGYDSFQKYTLPHLKTNDLKKHIMHRNNRLDRLYDSFKSHNDEANKLVTVNKYHESYSFICQNCSYRTSCMAGYMN